MPLYVFVGTTPRVWPDMSLEVDPGDKVEADTNPDPRWFDEETNGDPNQNKE